MMLTNFKYKSLIFLKLQFWRNFYTFYTKKIINIPIYYYHLVSWLEFWTVTRKVKHIKFPLYVTGSTNENVRRKLSSFNVLKKTNVCKEFWLIPWNLNIIIVFWIKYWFQFMFSVEYITYISILPKVAYSLSNFAYTV